MTSCRFGRNCAGYSLLELSLTLAVLGLIAAAAASAYLGVFSASREKLNADASLASVSGAVIAFSQSHHRLPCPDRSGSGYESLVSGVCETGLETGWFPYLSVGLSQPAPRERVIYGVYRVAGADLARAEENGGDVAGAPTFADGADLVRALKFAALQTKTNARIYLTGDGALSGAENCGGNVVSNPAFVLIAPGEDRDGDGKEVDGIHATLPAAGRCFAAPTRAVDTNFDDRTMAVSFYTLIGEIK